jgi:hypothetical protein
MNGRLGVTVIGNGVQVAYIVALVNVLLQLVVSFGVTIDTSQEALITTAVNLVLLILARAVHQAGAYMRDQPPETPAPPSGS